MLSYRQRNELSALNTSRESIGMAKDESKGNGAADEIDIRTDAEHEASALVEEKAARHQASEVAQRSWEALLKQRVAVEVAESEATLRALEKGEAKQTIK
jgi:hypothetical protein